MLKRPETTEEIQTLAEQLQSIKQVNISGVLYDADYIAEGGFGITLKFPYQDRPSILKIYAKGGEKINFRFARERRIHNQLQLRAGLNHIPSLNDRGLYTVDHFQDGVLFLNEIKYVEEYIGKEIVCSLQDIASGELMKDWHPNGLEEYCDVFESYSEGIDVFRKVGVADPDRNKFNASVSDSTALHIDFGSASMVDFNIFTFLTMLRNPEIFSNSKDRLRMLAYVFNHLHYINDNSFGKLGTLRVSDFKNIALLLVNALIGKPKPGLSVRGINKIIANYKDGDVEKRLQLFDQILNENLPVQNNDYLMVVLAGIDFNNIIPYALTDLESVWNWSELEGLAKETINVMDLPQGHVLGHPMSPCPMMLLGQIDYKDINAVAVCSVYQMAWTMFTKLTGGLLPVPMSDINLDGESVTTEIAYIELITNWSNTFNLPGIATAQISFERYFADGFIPFVTEEEFLNHISNSSESLLQGLDTSTQLEVYTYFSKLFGVIHYNELFAKSTIARQDYLNAGTITDGVSKILRRETAEA